MSYSLRANFSFNVRLIVSYIIIENKNKRCRLELKQIFNNIIINKNINSFNNNFNLLHNLNFFNNNFDLFI